MAGLDHTHSQSVCMGVWGAAGVSAEGMGGLWQWLGGGGYLSHNDSWKNSQKKHINMTASSVMNWWERDMERREGEKREVDGRELGKWKLY